MWHLQFNFFVFYWWSFHQVQNKYGLLLRPPKKKKRKKPPSLLEGWEFFWYYHFEHEHSLSSGDGILRSFVAVIICFIPTDASIIQDWKGCSTFCSWRSLKLCKGFYLAVHPSQSTSSSHGCWSLKPSICEKATFYLFWLSIYLAMHPSQSTSSSYHWWFLKPSICKKATFYLFWLSISLPSWSEVLTQFTS